MNVPSLSLLIVATGGDHTGTVYSIRYRIARTPRVLIKLFTSLSSLTTEMDSNNLDYSNDDIRYNSIV
jgi:hypothetical protein